MSALADMPAKLCVGAATVQVHLAGDCPTCVVQSETSLHIALWQTAHMLSDNYM